MAYTLRQTALPGCDPFNLVQPASTAQGIPALSSVPGTQVVTGGAAAEFVLCSLVLASATTLAEGQAYVIDGQFVATLLTTANSPRGQSVGIGRVNQTSVPIGTYGIWLQRSGNCPVASGASAVLGALAETTATGGTVNFTNTPTATTKLIVGTYLYATNVTFTGDLTNTSKVIQNVSTFTDIALGAAVSGTGIPGSTTIAAMDRVLNTITLSAAATATNATVTVTCTGVLTANLNRPYIDKTN